MMKATGIVKRVLSGLCVLLLLTSCTSLEDKGNLFDESSVFSESSQLMENSQPQESASENESEMVSETEPSPEATEEPVSTPKPTPKPTAKPTPDFPHRNRSKRSTSPFRKDIQYRRLRNCWKKRACALPASL